MSDRHVYTSGANAVLAAWRDFEKTRRAFPRLVELIERATGYQAVCLNSRFFGLQAVCGTEPPPDGWRFSEQKRCLIPDRDTEKGRHFAARVREANGPKRCHLPGMPGGYSPEWAEGRHYEPGVRLMHGTVWMVWPFDMEGHYDRELWSERTLGNLKAAEDDARPVTQEMTRV